MRRVRGVAPLILTMIRSQVLLRSGQMGIYEAAAAAPPTEPLPSARSSTLLVKFVKVLSRAFDIQHPEEEQKSVLAEQKRISRLLLPFVLAPAPGHAYAGVFFTGDRPCWVVATDKGSVRVFPSGHSVVHAFTTCSLWESKGDFLLYSEEVGRVCPSCVCARRGADAHDAPGPQPGRMDAGRAPGRPSARALRPTRAAILERRV